MSNLCHFCHKPLGGSYTYHWSRACHAHCVPDENPDLSSDDVQGLVEEVGFYLRALDDGKPYGTQRMRDAYLLLKAKIHAHEEVAKIIADPKKEGRG